MKNYFKYLYNHLLSLIMFLIASFLFPIVIVDVINNNNAYYEASFAIDNISNFEDELLVNKDKLISIKNSASKYENIDVEKMLENDDFTYTINNNNITIHTKIKYYDNFFISSSLSVGTRAKMFIKDLVLDIANEKCEVTFSNPKDIVEIKNYYNYGWLIGLYTTLAAIVIEIVISYILFKKNIGTNVNRYEYDNETMFKNFLSCKYWKLLIKPQKKVKDITTLAMLFALMLVCKLIPIPSGFGNLGIGFTYLFFAVTCMIYGPVYGLVVGFFSDIIGFFLFPSVGFFHLGYTLQAALTGFIYGLCFYRTKISFTKVFVSRVLVNFVINVLYGSFLYILVFYPDQKDNYKELYTSYMLLIALPKNVIYLLPQSLLLYYVIRVTLPVLNRFKLIPDDMVIKRNYK